MESWDTNRKPVDARDASKYVCVYILIKFNSLKFNLHTFLQNKEISYMHGWYGFGPWNLQVFLFFIVEDFEKIMFFNTQVLLIYTSEIKVWDTVF